MTDYDWTLWDRLETARRTVALAARRVHVGRKSWCIGWVIACYHCAPTGHPIAAHTRWANAIDHATRHANGHRTHP